ncbi:LysR family transcriptional regulator [Vibrio coralliilyticus]|uniref:LysR family transcriptional regulator n=1 Tax=Vibrio coralliilyticus TaxID=190893 RepID=UPI00155F7F94|nr:LysR family transcriptional regulator [Vibrio coralliilyticus]NRF62048.1 LysR family transcriptional regulator [Vibrio coralliilyticus]
MNWEPLKFDWNKARAFLVTAEEGSFSAAARALGMSQPTLGRQVTGLEEELGVVLIERVNQRIEVTPTGLELLRHLREMGKAASKFSLSADGQKTELEGTVRISCTDTLAVHVLPNLMRQLNREEPKIVIELLSSYEVTNILLRECDIAIRHTLPLDDDLIARKLPNQRVSLYYSKELQGKLEDPKCFHHIPFVGFMSNQQQYMDELNRLGLEVSTRNFVSKASTHVEHWSLVKAGMGIGMMAEAIAEQDPDVVKYHKMAAPIDIPTWLVTHRELHSNQRIRRVYDYLISTLSNMFSIGEVR